MKWVRPVRCTYPSANQGLLRLLKNMKKFLFLRKVTMKMKMRITTMMVKKECAGMSTWQTRTRS